MVLPLKECHPLSPEKSVQCNNDKGTHNASLRPSLCDSAPSTGQEHCLFRGANKTECLLGWGVRLPCSTPHPLLSSCQVCIQLPCFPLTGCLAKLLCSTSHGPTGNVALKAITKMYCSPAGMIHWMKSRNPP